MTIRLNFAKVRKIILGVFIASLLFGGGYFFGVKGYKAEVSKALKVQISREIPPDKNIDFSLFWQVWDMLNTKYFDKSKIIPSQLVYGAIEGMVAAVGDPYTMYLPPAQNKIVNDDLSGSFEGVGIEIGYKNTRLAVIAPLQDSPADKAGIKAGDYIVRIVDAKKKIDVDSQNLNLSQAVDYIRGPSGSEISLTLIRDGDKTPIVVNLTRSKITVPSVTLKWVGEGSDIAHLRISKFDSATVSEWNTAVGQITDKCEVGGTKCKGIIVDVRNNPGGYLQSAIDIASDFVKIGTVVVTQESGDGSKIEYKSDKLPRLMNYKVMMLINGGSASASEILAGALRDDRQIKLVGDKSFGKGTIQEPIDILGGSGLHVTTAKWLTPGGQWIHEKGIEPDIAVEIKEGETKDIQLQKAIEMF